MCVKQYFITIEFVPQVAGHFQLVRHPDPRVMIVRLFSGKKTDGHKKRAEDQAYEHDFSVCAFVSVMK